MWAIDWFSKLEFHSQYPPNSIPDDPDALDCFSSYLLMSGHEVLLVHRRICERFVASWFVSMFDGRCGGSGAATGEPWGTPKMTSEHQVKWQFWNRVWARNGRCADVPTRSFSCRTCGKKWDVFAGWIEYVSAKVGSRHWGTKLNFKNNIVPCFSHSILGIARRNRATPTMTISITHVNASMNESVSVALMTVWESPHWRNMRALRLTEVSWVKGVRNA